MGDAECVNVIFARPNQSIWAAGDANLLDESTVPGLVKEQKGPLYQLVESTTNEVYALLMWKYLRKEASSAQERH